MTRALLTTAALTAAVVVCAVLSLPPKQIVLHPSWSDGTVPGVVHVHTNRSDGRSAPADVAAAAARAGLKFIVFTDHGDATRRPEPPVYQSGVLCIDAVEISTAGGHYVALDMGPAPYPLGGEPADVADDVRRLGGFGVAAHPDSPKAELQWRDWTVPLDGLEVVNPDTSWRVHMFEGGWRPKLALTRALLTYPIRPAETIAGLLTNSPGLMTRWSALTATRRVVALAGIDAHSKLELKNVDPGDNRYSLPLPGYEASFRALSIRVKTERPLGHGAADDARQVMQAIRTGNLYTVVDGWATAPSFEFTASNRSGTAAQGGELLPDGPVTLRIRRSAPGGSATSIWRGSDLVAENRHEAEFTVVAGAEPAVYRAEVRRPADSGPAWIISNPIYVRSPAAPTPGAPAPSAPPLSSSVLLFDGRSAAGWSLEHDPGSLAALDVTQRVDGAELRFRYGLSGGSPTNQYAALLVDTPHGVRDRAAFTVRAEHPMRISVQVRTETEGATPERWQRSIYIDSEDREITVLFDTMIPVGATNSERVPAADVRKLMFVVDRTNSKSGASGRLWLRNVRVPR